jgi:hypothetical protein
MELMREEEKALRGEKGEALAAAYRILAAIGEATGAKKLVPVEWVHVSGVNYNTIGDAGLEFLDKFSRDARVAVKTTLNPMGYDRSKPEGIPLQFREKQETIVRAYDRMGVTPSFTCTPYEVFDLPPKNATVSFAESNAAVFSNSLMGLRTNKESALSALASAVTGKAPLSDLRIDENRRPRTAIVPDMEIKSELDYGLLGYFAGKTVKESCVALPGINPDRQQAKALAGAIGTSGSCGMFTTTTADAQEKISFGKREAKAMMDELSTADDGDIITFGSPQLGMQELEKLADMVEGRKFKKRCMVFCSKAIYNQASRIGLTGRIEKAGGGFMCDSCTCLTPYISRDEVDAVVTNSIKGAYYLNHSNRVKVALKDMKTIVKEYTTG